MNGALSYSGALGLLGSMTLPGQPFSESRSHDSCERETW